MRHTEVQDGSEEWEGMVEGEGVGEREGEVGGGGGLGTKQYSAVCYRGFDRQ